MAGGKRDDVDTRDRLLWAAGEVFAERGFRSATVREICQRAGANVAAVNYHFGDKETLYVEVLSLAHRCAAEGEEGPDAGGPAAARLGAFVRGVLRRMLDDGRPAWQGKLMAMEMVEPTHALPMLAKREIAPKFQALRAIVGELLGPAATARRTRMAAASIVGQCLFYKHARPVLAIIAPEQGYGPADIDAMADHITAFSLAALRGMAAGGRAARGAGASRARGRARR
jgi:AcrR family transcriptional regulator